MNKMGKCLKKVFMPLYKAVDTLIVTPISRVIYRLNKFSKSQAGKFDKLLNKPNSLILISLLIAAATFLMINNKAINLVETESQILSDQRVEVNYNSEKYVVEGVPERVDIILIGRKSDLYLAKQLGDHKIVLDLSDYKTGEYNVKLKYNHSVESVTYKLDPSTVTVKISEKVSTVKTLSYDLLNQDKVDSKLNVSNVILNESEVYVKGSKETLDRVANVKALIDVSKLGLTDSGEYDIDDLPMIAYDVNGKEVANVEIVPNKASAKIKVESYSVELPVKVVPNGKFATGFAIKSAVSSVQTVKVYGDQNIISKLSYIEANIDVKDLSENKTFNVTLTKPSGVRYMSETNTTVTVNVSKETEIELDGISIDAINLGSQYTAGAVNTEDTTCTVIIKGVSDVINNIKPNQIHAYVDLTGYTPGTYEVPVKVEGDDLTVTYSPKVSKIQIKISQAK